VQGKLQEGLISLGKFESVIDEVLTWLDNTSKSLDDTVPVYGDPKQIETELSKLKVNYGSVLLVLCSLIHCVLTALFVQ